MVNEPFWCEELGKYLQIIPNEEADKICRDVQLYCKNLIYGHWGPDRTPGFYRSDPPHDPPSYYPNFAHAIEVHIGKPEYDPPTGPPLTPRA